MAFKFPFTNYHELNLTWVLDQLKKLFEESAENVTTIENYNGRLTAVETELPLVADTAQGAAQSAAAAASLAQQAKSTADTAQENAIQAQGAAGQARQEAQAAQTAADAATQAAQQAQATAQNFDGRITQAQNNAAEALEASRSFENRVQAAITTANNAAQTATNAQGIATRADQNAALALDTLNAQRSELERIGAEQVERITEETESGKTEIETLAQSVLDSIPSDYTALSNLVDKKAPVIINRASGSIASFDDGADDMKIQKLVVNIEPVQAGSGDPSPDNVRPISGHTGLTVTRTGANVWDEETRNGYLTQTGTFVANASYIAAKNYIDVIPNTTYAIINQAGKIGRICWYDENKRFISTASAGLAIVYVITAPNNARYMLFDMQGGYGNTYNHDISINYPSTDTTYYPYTSNRISVTFPSEAGTVYGGTVTLNPDRTGTLVVDRRFIDLSTITPSSVEYGGKTINYSDAGFKPKGFLIADNDLKCNRYKPVSYSGTFDDSIFFVNLSIIRIMSSISRGATPQEVKAYFVENPCHIVYRVSNPLTYILTSEQVSGILSTLYGQNNILVDAGPVSVDYPADSKLYIDGKLAELQATILENI